MERIASGPVMEPDTESVSDRGLALENALRQDQLQRGAEWKRRARRAYRPLEVVGAGLVGLWGLSWIYAFFALYAWMTGHPLPVPLNCLIFVGVILSQFVLPKLYERWLRPLLTRHIERVIAAARAEDADLNWSDYQ